MAKAKLPDFFGLAGAVTKSLGVPSDHPALMILNEARELGQRTGVEGLISADRVFGLLERDFLVRDIESAVITALKPDAEVDLSAHKILLDLATTAEGNIQLVTTNFDRLLDQCREDIPTFDPSHLPTPSQFHGLVYLHGKASASYEEVEGNGLVLSSSDFGRAYLSEGWATAFFREVIERYHVVFVGYAADDPPIQYLLEALNKTTGKLEGVYAFQSGDTNYAHSRWSHKGVEAIPYNGTNKHAALWNTLEAWAERARAPERWTNRVIRTAQDGPELLKPHERGQVAHIVSTTMGAKAFSENETTPPATWLCVFDPLRRYATPQKVGRIGEDSPRIDPFELYGLDDDVVPDAIAPNDHYTRRECPPKAWDAFSLNSFDEPDIRTENCASFRGHWSSHAARLPSRLAHLGSWISKTTAQPAAVWWSTLQTALHPAVRNMIYWQLGRDETKAAAHVKDAWQYLFDYWDGNWETRDKHWIEFKEELNKVGWNARALRKFAIHSRPCLVVEPIYWSLAAPPSVDNAQRIADLMRLDVKYANLPGDITIPDEWLPSLVVQLRRNLEIAVELESEIGGYGLEFVAPIQKEDDPTIDHYDRSHGLSGWILYFVAMLEKLLAMNSELAKAETEKWPSSDETIFSKLRIWAAGKPELVSDEAFGKAILALSDEVFWDDRGTRDLLLTIARRWGGQEQSVRNAIEERILNGPSRWPDESDEELAKRKAWQALNRLNWLQINGAELTLDIHTVNAELMKTAPDWKPEYAENAARSFESRGGTIREDREHSSLLNSPLDRTLTVALEISGRQGHEFVEHNPFAGLSEQRPVRAFAALRLAAKRDEYPEWAWRTFFAPQQRQNDKPRFTAFIGLQILHYPNEQVQSFIRPACDWLQKSTKTLAPAFPKLFADLIEKLTRVLAEFPVQGHSGIVRGSKTPDWPMEALNSPTGDLAQAIFDDPQQASLKREEGLPKLCRSHIEALLALPGDPGRYALVIFARELNWLFAVDPEWTGEHLLEHLNSETEQDKLAFWSGFLWGRKIEGRRLFETLKPHMIRLAKTDVIEKRGHAEALAGLLLSGWHIIDEETDQRWLSNEDFRDVLAKADDEFRSRVLWLAESWWLNNDEKRDENSLIELLRKVWPRQIAAKSSLISARLCDIAFSCTGNFTELTNAILPLLTKADGEKFSALHLYRDTDNVVDKHPKEALALLYAALPDDAQAWPYGIQATLKRIQEADSNLAKDEKLIELLRKWNSR